MEKVCGTCLNSKDVKEFSKNKSKKDGLQSSCKLCRKKEQHEYFEKYYNENQSIIKIRIKRNKDKNKQQYREWKETLECKICGEKCSYALDFHHLDSSEKDHNISHMISRNCSLKTILKEVKKCIVVCKNCHAKVHAGIIMLDYPSG